MHLPLPLYFFLNILAKQSGRFYQKHNDQNCKYNSISHLGRNIGFTKDFDNPQQYTTNQSTGDRSDSAKYSRHESFNTGHGTGVRCQGRICGT
mgnify:FL=1